MQVGGRALIGRRYWLLVHKNNWAGKITGAKRDCDSAKLNKKTTEKPDCIDHAQG